MQPLLYDCACTCGRAPGRLYLTYDHLCFYSNVLGWKTKHVVSMADVGGVEETSTTLGVGECVSVYTKDRRELHFVLIMGRERVVAVRLCPPRQFPRCVLSCALMRALLRPNR